MMCAVAEGSGSWSQTRRLRQAYLRTLDEFLAADPGDHDPDEEFWYEIAYYYVEVLFRYPPFGACFSEEELGRMREFRAWYLANATGPRAEIVRRARVPRSRFGDAE